jgi:hypothetical protein
MSTTDTNTIDEKKAEDTGTTETSDVNGFVKNYLYSIIFTIAISIFILGGFGLYTTKVAQGGVLPDNPNMAPYTNIDRIVEEIPININVMRPYLWSSEKETLSQKAIFNTEEYLMKFKDTLICKLKQYSQPNSNMFANGALYFSHVYDSMCAYNYWAVNTIFHYLSFLPEFLIMMLYSFFGVFLLVGLYYFNLCMAIFFHIINIPQLVRRTDKNNNNEWESQSEISFFNSKIFLLFFWLFAIIGSLVVFPFCNAIYGLVSPLTASYHLEGSDMRLNIYDFIKDTFIYKRVFFVILSSISLLSNASNYLGKSSILPCIIAIVIAYFMGVYTNIMPNEGENGFTHGLNKLVQAKVTIKYNGVDDKGKKIPKKIDVCSTSENETTNIIETEQRTDGNDGNSVNQSILDQGQGSVSEPQTMIVNNDTMSSTPEQIQPQETVSEPQTQEQIQPPAIQTGGKKHNKKSRSTTQKKYNIRFI